ncbi:MAG: hypothetical protein BJ554DRAFT_4934 [Olpidium bornovanus]|uniref:Uncharacterized protein n=1 Tax=Olpidium bornovanus TaxID=278681 RepID=A0A8H7ZM49_9FUNG|nr:MAG: hypothetical protein BJ554DRAFT_4934 [Olpidium bornovanus]
MGAASAARLALARALARALAFFALAAALVAPKPMLAAEQDPAPQLHQRPPPESFAWFVSSAVRSHVNAAKLVVMDVAANFAAAPPHSKMFLLRDHSGVRRQAMAAFRARVAAVVPGFELPVLPGSPSGKAPGAARAGPSLSTNDAAVRAWLVSMADALDVGLQIYLSENPPDSRESWAAWAHRIERLNWALDVVAFDAGDLGDDLTSLAYELYERVCPSRSGEDGDRLLNHRGPPAEPTRIRSLCDRAPGTSCGHLFDYVAQALQMVDFALVDPFERRGAALALILRGGDRFDRCYQDDNVNGRRGGSFADSQQLRHLFAELFYYHNQVSGRYPEREYV